MIKTTAIIETWIKQTIIGLNLCPFAQNPFKEGRVQLRFSGAIEIHEAYIFLLDQIDYLQSHPNQSLLAIYPEYKISFDHFLELLAQGEAAIQELRLGDEWMLIAFHPEFRFKKLPKNHKAHLINSSPYPLIHLLSHREIEKLGLKIGEAEKISQRNGEQLQSMDDKSLAKHFPWAYPQ